MSTERLKYSIDTLVSYFVPSPVPEFLSDISEIVSIESNRPFVDYSIKTDKIIFIPKNISQNSNKTDRNTSHNYKVSDFSPKTQGKSKGNTSFKPITKAQSVPFQPTAIQSGNTQRSEPKPEDNKPPLESIPSDAPRFVPQQATVPSFQPSPIPQNEFPSIFTTPPGFESPELNTNPILPDFADSEIASDDFLNIADEFNPGFQMPSEIPQYDSTQSQLDQFSSPNSQPVTKPQHDGLSIGISADKLFQNLTGTMPAFSIQSHSPSSSIQHLPPEDENHENDNMSFDSILGDISQNEREGPISLPTVTMSPTIELKNPPQIEIDFNKNGSKKSIQTTNDTIQISWTAPKAKIPSQSFLDIIESAKTSNDSKEPMIINNSGNKGFSHKNQSNKPNLNKQSNKSQASKERRKTGKPDFRNQPDVPPKPRDFRPDNIVFSAPLEPEPSPEPKPFFIYNSTMPTQKVTTSPMKTEIYDSKKPEGLSPATIAIPLQFGRPNFPQ